VPASPVFTVPCGLHEHGAAFNLCRGLVFYSLRNDENLTVPDRHIAIPEANAHLSVQGDKHLIGVFVVMPNELILKFDELKVIVSHLGNDLRGPGLGEFVKLFTEVDRGLHAPPFSMPESSSPGEFHPEALTEPDVSLSTHPALIDQPKMAALLPKGSSSAMQS
jgi:hypothetical protein